MSGKGHTHKSPPVIDSPVARNEKAISSQDLPSLISEERGEREFQLFGNIPPFTLPDDTKQLLPEDLMPHPSWRDVETYFHHDGHDSTVPHDQPHLHLGHDDKGNVSSNHEQGIHSHGGGTQNHGGGFPEKEVPLTSVWSFIAGLIPRHDHNDLLFGTHGHSVERPHGDSHHDDEEPEHSGHEVSEKPHTHEEAYHDEEHPEGILGSEVGGYVGMRANVGDAAHIDFGISRDSERGQTVSIIGTVRLGKKGRSK